MLNDPPPELPPPPRHVVFAVDYLSSCDDVYAVMVTCLCGEATNTDSVREALDWFGAHCYRAALDRAVQILQH